MFCKIGDCKPYDAFIDLRKPNLFRELLEISSQSLSVTRLGFERTFSFTEFRTI
jgi:hypothetical protein